MTFAEGRQRRRRASELRDDGQAGHLALQDRRVHDRQFAEHDGVQSYGPGERRSQNVCSKYPPVERLITPHEMIMAAEGGILVDAWGKAGHAVDVPKRAVESQIQYVA